MGGRPDGNRQDNRQRGNAAQLLEKYKSMARDAQLGGDRVQTEYYLQYADHYYRILGESRARFDEQRRQRGEFDEDAENGSSFNEPGFQHGDDEQMEAGDDQRSPDDGDDDDRPERGERFERPQPRESRDRYERPERTERPERPERAERAERGPSRPRYGRDERNRNEIADGTGGDAPQAGNAPGGNFESIAFDALPPAIGRDSPAGEPEAKQEAPRPKRRATRKARPADDDGEVAPAA